MLFTGSAPWRTWCPEEIRKATDLAQLFLINSHKFCHLHHLTTLSSSAHPLHWPSHAPAPARLSCVPASRR